MPKPWDPNESESDYSDEEDTDAPAPVPPAQVAPAPVAPAPVPIAVGPVEPLVLTDCVKPWWDPNESESDYWDEENTDALHCFNTPLC